MIPQTKRSRPSTDLGQLPQDDLQALERVAAMLNIPVPELLGQAARERQNSTQSMDFLRATEMDHLSGQMDHTPQGHSNHWSNTGTQTTTEGHHTYNSHGLGSGVESPFHGQDTYQGHPYVLQSQPEAWHMQVGDEGYATSSGGLDTSELIHTGSWFQGNRLNAPWSGVHTGISNLSDYQHTPNNGNIFQHPYNPGHDSALPDSAIQAQDFPFPMDPPVLSQSRDVAGQIPSDKMFSSSSDDLTDSVESESRPENRSWEDLGSQQATPPMPDQLASSASTNNTDWSLIALPSRHSSSGKSSSPGKPTKSEFIEWIDPCQKSTPIKKRRGPFQDKQLQEETGETRKLKACVRCRSQKTRVG